MPILNLNQNQFVQFPIPISVILGGTGASDIVGARNNLGLTYAAQIGAPLAFGGVSLSGSSGTWSGLGFTDSYGDAIFMHNTNSYFHGVWSDASNHPGKWLWWYMDGQFKVFGDSAIQGTFLSLDKGLGSLPGYPTSRYPTIKTDFDAVYFSVAGQFSAQITAGGTYTAMSDFYKKENIEDLDCQEVLNLIEYLPTVTYSFKGADPRIRSAGTFAQAFWQAFRLGGDIDVLNEDSPNHPNKMLAPSDVAGICLAAIKGLVQRVKTLQDKVDELTDEQQRQETMTSERHFYGLD